MTNHRNKKGRLLSEIRSQDYNWCGITSSRYEAVTENKAITFCKWAFVVALTVSLVTATIILIVDVDLLKNGSTYFLAKFIKWIKKSSNITENEENLEHFYSELVESRRALYLSMPMMGVLIACSTIILMSLLGCVAAGSLSCTMIAGFSTFMFIATVMSSFLLIWGLYRDMEGTVADKFAMKKIGSYNCSSVNMREGDDCEKSFDKIIDYVQISMSCCGFKSIDDWGGVFPSSCCPPCSQEPSTCLQPCLLPNIQPTPCLESIRKYSLRPDYFVGRIGIAMVGIVSFMGLNFIISFILFLLVRAQRTLHFEQESQLELVDNYYGKRTLDSSIKSGTLLDRYNSIALAMDRSKIGSNNGTISQNLTTEKLLRPHMMLRQHDQNVTLTPERRNSAFY